MMIHLFVSDLDGTLLNESKGIDERDRAGLVELASRGVQRCLASGRMRREMIRVAEAVGGPFHLICQNGAHVETADGRVLAQFAFEARLASAVYEMVSSWDVLTVACLHDRDLVAERTGRVLAVEQRVFTEYVTIPNLGEQIGLDLFPTKYSIVGDRGLLETLEVALQTQFPKQIETFLSSSDCLDVVPAGVSKGVALRVLMEHLGIDVGEVACIGDAYNDLSMFEVSDNSFAMHHADAALRAQTTHTTQCVGDAAAQVIRWNLEEAKLV